MDAGEVVMLTGLGANVCTQGAGLEVIESVYFDGRRDSRRRTYDDVFFVAT